MSTNPAQEAVESLQPLSPATSPPNLSRTSSQPTPAEPASMDGALPENDGMNSLRQKLQEIRQLAVSTEEKAQRMHYLMMQDYISHKTSLPSPFASPDGRPTNGITRDDMPHLHAPPAIDPDNPYNLRPGDLEPVYSPLPPIRHDDVVIEDDGNDSSSETSSDLLPDLGCMHYKRNVKVQCFDCQQWYPCRHCHDQAHDLPFPHALNRKKTKNMLSVNMEIEWRRLDEEIRRQPMPEEGELEGLLPAILEGEAIPAATGVPQHRTTETDAAIPPPTQDTTSPADPATSQTNNSVQPPPPAPRRPREVYVNCNDCHSRTWTPFHWLGLKCQRCDSYNTHQMAPSHLHETDTERLLRQQTSAQQSVIGPEFTGEAVLRSAGIGVGEREGMLAVPSNGQGTGQGAASVELLDVPSSPATHPVRSPPHSPGRYFVDASSSPPNEPRRSSFTTFSAPSMPNLPTLSSLSASTPGLPRLPRLPNLPNLPNLPDLQAMRGYATLPNVGNFGVGERLGDGWERTYEMMSAVGRSLSPMRYYLNGLDERDHLEAEGGEHPDEGKADGRGLAGFGGSVNSNGGLRAGLERRSSAWSEPGLGWLGRERERWTGKQEEVEDVESGSEDEEEEEEVDMLGEEEEGGKGMNPFDELELMGHR
ncbi:unnamed protein product [Zymoseptoria tritici ST99CH_1E4]|uniref:CHY-type domain-containing protein n=1 Tax=Zymoseptoria tritici ST99CH_1E4 TaxID=1276532 RepID=A0A2H1H5E1_ZYMTR|nr:unnamed protein product [Zymoseptoria tritici ST99CH_1E4]